MFVLEDISFSLNASEGLVISGEEQFVGLGEVKRDVRIEVDGGRLIICFLKSSVSAIAMFEWFGEIPSAR